MKTLSTHTTSKGNELEFCTFDFLGKDTIVVRDTSCQIERTYTIGHAGILDFDYYETGKGTMIESFDQVMNAWKNEEIHF